MIAVNLTAKGEGFIDQPKIFIESLTGFNANITPVFEICRVGDLVENEAVPGPDLIQVIDCVGKIT